MKKFTLFMAMLVTLSIFVPVTEVSARNNKNPVRIVEAKSSTTAPLISGPENTIPVTKTFEGTAPVLKSVIDGATETKAVDVAETTRANSSVKNLVFDDFEKSVSYSWVPEMANDTYSGTISKVHAQTGSSSLRIELVKSDAIVRGSKRSEIALRSREEALAAHTYTFGMLLPKGGSEDYALDPHGSEIIAQWHNEPDQGEDWTVPPLVLRTVEGRYIIERYWDDAAISTTAQIKQKGYHALYDLGPYEGDKGKFVTWSFKIKWGWLASQNPVLEVYKDGVKVLDLNGKPNTTNDKRGPYMKLGIYKWDWAQDKANNNSILNKRVIYYDNVSII